MNRTIFSDAHQQYREMVRTFVTREIEPHLSQWEKDGVVDRSLWEKAGERGITGVSIPVEFGGAGITDFVYYVVLHEELARVGAASLSSGFTVQDNIVVPYLVDLGTAEQQQRWLPGIAAGKIVGALAMTEPDAGSDLQGIRSVARRDGDTWILNGRKTFITNGGSADIVIVAARTEPASGARGMSLLVVEANQDGFSRGPSLNKVGLHAQDTAELVFEDVRVPATEVLGQQGRGFFHIMEHLPLERITIATAALAGARAIFADTVRYCTQRKAFGQPIAEFQHTKFVLAEISTEIDVTQAYLDGLVQRLNAGVLTPVDAAKAKWWATELQKRVVDRCLQLHGGYGYMLEYPVARAYIDSRVQTIYGGTTEIMKEVIGRDIVKRAGATVPREDSLAG